VSGTIWRIPLQICPITHNTCAKSRRGLLSHGPIYIVLHNLYPSVWGSSSL
jgi:hypothetical protein